MERARLRAPEGVERSRPGDYAAGSATPLAGRAARIPTPPIQEAMGRIFETRKATMFARWDRMSKLFSRIGKEITIAVKKGGPNPDSNPALRRVIQNARAANMPKD